MDLQEVRTVSAGEDRTIRKGDAMIVRKRGGGLAFGTVPLLPARQ